MPNVDVGGECIIGSDVFLSTKSTILPRTSVADSTNIGTASVILKDIIEPNGTFFGNPGRRMRNK
jgi:acetyltransferase-like isoleucine patch superfamily enzyme